MPVVRGRGSARQSMRRLIHKQGYLKKMPNSAKFGSKMKKPERRWFVFGVMNYNDPYLEYYESEEAMLENTPINIIFLESCMNVVRERLRPQQHEASFTVVLHERYLTLIAATRDIRADWVRCLETQLTRLGILHVNLTGKNDYVDIKGVTRPKFKRKTTSGPLPSPPTNGATEHLDDAEEDSSRAYYNNGVLMRRRSRSRTESNSSNPQTRATVIGLGQSEEQGATAAEETYEFLWNEADDPSMYAVPHKQNKSSQKPKRRTGSFELSDNRESANSLVGHGDVLSASIRDRPLPLVPAETVVGRPLPMPPIDTEHTHGGTTQTAGLSTPDSIISTQHGSTVISLSNNTVEYGNISSTPQAKHLSKRTENATPNTNKDPNSNAVKGSETSETAIYCNTGSFRDINGNKPLIDDTQKGDKQSSAIKDMSGSSGGDSLTRTDNTMCSKSDNAAIETRGSVVKDTVVKPKTISLTNTSNTDDSEDYSDTLVLVDYEKHREKMKALGHFKGNALKTANEVDLDAKKRVTSKEGSNIHNAENDYVASPLKDERSSHPRMNSPENTQTSSTSNHMSSSSIAISHVENSPVSPNTPNPQALIAETELQGAAAAAESGVDTSSFPTPPLSPTGSSKAQEAMASPENAIGGWNIAPPTTGDAPPPYMPKGVLEKGANKSLRQTQVEELMKQKSATGGVKLVLRKKDCHHMLALADCYDHVWIVGWNHKARPFLSNAFHIGDQVFSINGQVIENSKMAYKLMKQCKEKDKVTFILLRLSCGRAFLFRREIVGQGLGIIRNGGTAEIEGVEPQGLAARQGLPAHAPPILSGEACAWCITEVNNRPLNFFYKGNEIERLLGAVGRETSIVVHPLPLIQHFRKHLKAIKNHKDFLFE